MWYTCMLCGILKQKHRQIKLTTLIIDSLFNFEIPLSEAPLFSLLSNGVVWFQTRCYWYSEQIHDGGMHLKLSPVWHNYPAVDITFSAGDIPAWFSKYEGSRLRLLHLWQNVKTNSQILHNVWLRIYKIHSSQLQTFFWWLAFNYLMKLMCQNNT